MTTLKTAIESKKIVDELAEIQKRPLKYAVNDLGVWLADNLDRLQELAGYIVDDLSQDDGYSQLALNHEHSAEIEGRYRNAG